MLNIIFDFKCCLIKYESIGRKKLSSFTKELISEFIGTMILILFGAGVVAMVVAMDAGNYVTITLAWGLAVTMGIYASQYSGAHINPAVTLALAVTKRFAWQKVPAFILVQTAGAFTGAALVYINYYTQIDTNSMAGIFTTFPAVTDNLLPGLFDQILGTFLLVFMILAIGDRLAKAKAEYLGPLLVGLLVVVIGMSFGAMHGYAINPARDFGPRLFVALAGFKNNGLTDGSWIFIIPIIGPIIGGILGAVIYDFSMGKINKDNT